MTDLTHLGVIDLAAKLAAAVDRFAEIDREADEYRDRLERQGREYRKRIEGNAR